jgi:hypothetical protein
MSIKLPPGDAHPADPGGALEIVADVAGWSDAAHVLGGAWVL